MTMVSKRLMARAGAVCAMAMLGGVVLTGCGSPSASADDPAVSAENPAAADLSLGAAVLDPALELAVHEAILDRALAHPDATTVVEDHRVLGVQVSDSALTQVYTLVLLLGLSVDDGALVQQTGSHVPCVLTFVQGDDGAYDLQDYWEPRDGSFYASDIEEHFGALGSEAVEQALDLPATVRAQIQSCYAQALAQEGLAADPVLDALWAELVAHAPEATSAEALVAADPLVYRELTYYGDAALGWACERFRTGAPAESEGEALWLLMSDLLGEELALQAETDTAQPVSSQDFSSGAEAFNAWFVQAGKLLDEKGLDYLAVHAPKTYLLLTAV